MERRESIELTGFSHANPIPSASRRGPFVFSGGFTGRHPQTHELPVDLPSQLANIFAHVRSLMAAVGGTTDDIMRMTIWLADAGDREALNREWLAMFPDAASRPARHVVQTVLQGDLLVQLDLIAIVDT